MIKPRALARRLALQYCFMCDLNAEWNTITAATFLREHGDDEIPDAEKCRDFALELISAVVDGREEIDHKISAALKNWDFSRIAAVERNILRIATAELAWKKLDKKIIISEALFLADSFGDKNSAKFVAGVLNALAE